jgi:hypothetical protein
MSENEQKGLRRLDIDSKLPAGFNDLSEEEQRAVINERRGGRILIINY